jgi:alpha-D-ribose 1-methylphosphonate 5-triphosphate synthase subunit PhnG
MMNHSEIVAEGSIEAVRRIAEAIERDFSVRVLKPPAPGMAMVRHIEPLENALFLLGEAFITECEVEIDGLLGYGCTLGDAPVRALCGALVDAVVGGGHAEAARIRPLLEAEEARIRERWLRESKAAASTRVNFEVR